MPEPNATATIDAMVEAAKQGDLDRVRRLLETAPDVVNARTTAGESPLLAAAYYGQHDALAVLSERATLDVFEAATVGNVARLRALLAADPAVVHAYSSDGWTALHLAAFFGQPAAVDVLLEGGADLAALARNAQANMPLHAALAGRANPTVVEALLAHGAPVRGRGAGGVTPLHLAASRGDAALVQRLLAAGADRADTMDEGQTAAALATERGHKEVAARLQ